MGARETALRNLMQPKLMITQLTKPVSLQVHGSTYSISKSQLHIKVNHIFHKVILILLFNLTADNTDEANSVSDDKGDVKKKLDANDTRGT